MPIQSYLVIPSPGEIESLSRRLAALPGCDVARAENRDIVLLVTETADPTEERLLREAITETAGVASLILTFGEVAP